MKTISVLCYVLKFVDVWNWQNDIRMFCRERYDCHIDHEVWIIIKYAKKLLDKEQADFIFSFYLSLNELKSLFWTFNSFAWQKRQGREDVFLQRILFNIK